MSTANAATSNAVQMDDDGSRTPTTTIQRSLSTLQRLNPFPKLKPDSSQPIEFPPTSWNLDESPALGTSDTVGQSSVQPAISDCPEPRMLAKRIRDSIDSLPEPSFPSSGNDTPVIDPKGPPPPPGVDSKLTAFLSSEAIMNGYAAGKESVFTALERLRHAQWKRKDKEGDGQNADDGDNDGIMMYTPLLPTSDSQVELAECDLEYADPETFIPTPPNEPVASELEDNLTAKSKERKPGSFIWTLGRKSPTPNPAPPTSKTTANEAREQQEKDKDGRAHRVWVPSETQMSVQVMWWGYRIYLPPPVMVILDGGHLVATKRAAMITAALKWLLDKVPQAMVPPPLKPALMLFKRLAPFLGYIGVFIAYSWKSIKSHDKGHGVTLTATWLLTMALIPSTWEPDLKHDPGKREQAPCNKEDAELSHET